MIKPVKFALVFNGRKANTLEELKEYFSFDIVEHYKNGSLLRWLAQRDLQNDITALQMLKDTPFEELYSKLAEIFNLKIELSEEEKEKNKLATLIQKAEAGDAEAQCDLAGRYYDGEEVSQDYAEAVKWFRKAAEAGDAEAQLNLATCYQDGTGVTQDYSEAKKWYSKAAEQGNSDAQNYLKSIEVPDCFIFVKGGTFSMGGSDGEYGATPIHSVTVSDFYIGKYEVTQKEWQAIMGSNPSYFKGDDLPVEQVSWDDCQEFIRKLNAKTGKKHRLPTEAEWEYAARGGASTTLSHQYSGSDDLGSVAWYSDNSGSKTHPVGQKQANELGIYDMSGNVWEWCSDWYGDYHSGSQTNPQGASSGSYRVYRGGSWINFATNCRVAIRYDYTPDYRNYGIGFRMVLSP